MVILHVHTKLCTFKKEEIQPRSQVKKFPMLSLVIHVIKLFLLKLIQRSIAYCTSSQVSQQNGQHI